MKRILLAIILLAGQIFACTGSAPNQSCTVKPVGGDYPTIGACVSGIMSVGGAATCTVFAGTYTESPQAITVPDGAGGGSYNLITVNGTDVVTDNGLFTLNAHTRLNGINVATAATTTSCAKVAYTTTSAATDVYITNNSFTGCSTIGAPSSNSTGSYPTFVYITGNTFSYMCSASNATPTPNVCRGLTIRGQHWLVENNTFSHTTGTIRLIGQYNVIRNNTIHDLYGRDLISQYATRDCVPFLGNTSATVAADGVTITTTGAAFQNLYPGTWVQIPYNSSSLYTVATWDSGNNKITVTPISPAPALTPGTISIGNSVGNGSNCHIGSLVGSEPSVSIGETAAQYNLVEGNTVYNVYGNDTKIATIQGDVCAGQCHNLIFRFNIGAHIGSSAILDDNANNSSVNPGFNLLSVYNNTWVDTQASQAPAFQVGDNYSHNSTYPIDINNIFVLQKSIPAGQYWNPYASDASTSPTFTYGHNLGWCTTDGATSASPCSLKGYLYASGSFASDPGNIQLPTTGTQTMFANYSTSGLGDLSLAAGSSAIASGTSLATVVSGCNSPSLVMSTVAPFSDGLGMVNPDALAVGTVSNTATISTVNYSTNTVTFTGSVPCTNGASVWLKSKSDNANVLTGSAPDMGAVPYQTPAAPSVVTLHASGAGSSTSSGFNTADNNIICTYNGTSLSCSPGPSANYANSSNLTINVTSAAGSSISSVTATAPLGSATCTQNSLTNWTCAVDTGTGNADVYAVFMQNPAVTISSDIPYCNVIQKSCTPTLTVTGSHLNVGGGTLSVVDGSNTPIVDTSTGLQAVCSLGVVNAFCGDGTMTGPWTIHTTIANWNTSLAQETATVNASAGGPPATATVSVGLTGRTANTPPTVTH